MISKIDDKYWDVILTEKQQFFNVNFKETNQEWKTFLLIAVDK